VLAPLAALLLAAAPDAAPVPARAAPPPRPARLPTSRELRLDALDAALAARWGRLFAVAGLMLEREPLDGDAYRLAGDAAVMGGREGEGRRLLEKAQLLAPLDGTARLLAALSTPAGPPAPGEAPAPPPPLRALAWLDLAGNRHLAIPRFACLAAARALAEAPADERALQVRAALRCPEEAPAEAPAPPPRTSP
jgi:hypothetical protein